MTAACVWRAIGVLSDPRPIEVLFAGLAPGLVGIYQLDFRVPADWPYLLFTLIASLRMAPLLAYCGYRSA